MSSEQFVGHVSNVTSPVASPSAAKPLGEYRQDGSTTIVTYLWQESALLRSRQRAALPTTAAADVTYN